MDLNERQGGIEHSRRKVVQFPLLALLKYNLEVFRKCLMGSVSCKGTE